MLELLATGLLAYIAITIVTAVVLAIVSIFVSPFHDYHMDPDEAARAGFFWPALLVAIVADAVRGVRRRYF